MVIEFDCGNTAVKWRCKVSQLRGNLTWAELASGSHFAFERLGLPVGARRARISSVAGETRTQALVDFLALRGVSAALAHVQSGANGVHCGYTLPEKLGVDRWLAIQAALALVPAGRLLVVDAGSAITVDVCEPGQHLGGFIGPGLQLMRTALYSGTHAVKVPELPVGLPVHPGADTQAAVSGALAMMLRGLVREAAERFGPIEQFVFTGGGGAILAAEFAPSICVPDLVLDGLGLVLA